MENCLFHADLRTDHEPERKVACYAHVIGRSKLRRAHSARYSAIYLMGHSQSPQHSWREEWPNAGWNPILP
jgi:hypothetical protein